MRLELVNSNYRSKKCTNFRRKSSREIQESEFQKHFLVLTMNLNLIEYGDHINTYVEIVWYYFMRKSTKNTILSKIFPIGCFGIKDDYLVRCH